MTFTNNLGKTSSSQPPPPSYPLLPKECCKASFLEEKRALGKGKKEEGDTER